MVELSKNAEIVLAKRYYRKNEKGEPTENAEQLFRRVAKNIAQAEKNYGAKDEEMKKIEDQFFNAMFNLEFLPNSPTLTNAGTTIQQLAACFVLPVNDSMEGIFDAVKAVALIQKSGGGTGMSFSRLRPSGDKVDKTQGVSSGPISFMSVFNATTETIKQGGVRRGANMGCLRIDHPNILQFIDCKKDTKMFNNFNISIAVTDKFMKAIEKNKDYDIINPRSKEVTDTIKAKDVFDKIIDNAWLNGEPGVLFIDRINRDNPTPKLGEIESTNPCGEQPLLPWEACNLGSINLMKMLNKDGDIDWEKLKATVYTAVRFLDDVIDMSKYPLPQIEQMVKANRKIGLGVMGWADILVAMEIPYNSKEALRLADKLMKFINEESKEASAELAKVRGVFANFKDSIHDVKGGWKLRNATTTTIAPTGTLSIISNVSSGIEPLFAVAYIRNIMDGTKLTEVHPMFEAQLKKAGLYSDELIQKISTGSSIQDMKEIPDAMKDVFVVSHDIEAEWHVKMQAAFQKHVDNAVSKTINLPKEATREDVKNIFILAYEEGCKGITVYRDGSRDEQVLSTKSSDSKEPEKAIKEKARPAELDGKTFKIDTAQCGKMYLTVNTDAAGQPREVFCTMGRSGECIRSHQDALSRVISHSLGYGIPLRGVIKALRGVGCPKPTLGPTGTNSCLDMIGRQFEKYAKEQIVIKKVGAAKCPECGTMLAEGHCDKCPDCGWSSCGG